MSGHEGSDNDEELINITETPDFFANPAIAAQVDRLDTEQGLNLNIASRADRDGDEYDDGGDVSDELSSEYPTTDEEEESEPEPEEDNAAPEQGKRRRTRKTPRARARRTPAEPRRPHRPAPTEPVRPELTNVVASHNYGCAIDLKALHLKLKCVTYAPSRFNAAVIRFPDSRQTAMLFDSGKVSVTGAKSVTEAELTVRRVYILLKSVAGVEDVRLQRFTFVVSNCVARASVPWGVNLETLSKDTSYGDQAQGEGEGDAASPELNADDDGTDPPTIPSDDAPIDSIMFEPEIFPAACVRLAHPKVSVAVFVSGRVMLTGAKSADDLDQAFDFIVPFLEKHRLAEG